MLSFAKCVACGMRSRQPLTQVAASVSSLTSRLLNSSSPLGLSSALSRAHTHTSSPSAPPLSAGLRQPLVSRACAFSPPPPVGLAASTAPLLASTTPAITQVRERARVNYRPSAWKRVNKHGIEKRLRSRGGIEVLWRRFLKKRHTLTPFDRILSGTVKGMIHTPSYLKYNQHLVNPEVKKRLDDAIKKRYK